MREGGRAMRRWMLAPRRWALLLALAATVGGGAPAARGQAPGDSGSSGVGFRDPFLDGGGVGPELVPIPGGAFIMGSRPGAPGAQPFEVPHEVVLAPFAMARREVTNAEYARFLGEVADRDGDGVPYVVADGAGLRHEAGGYRPADGAEQLPVVGVSWQGALAYGRWLSRRTGQAYRLPTEAEWERAARAGSAATWPWGEAPGAGRLNCAGPGGRLAPVGSYPADAYSVFDLLGNAWEWTLDCFAPDFYFYAPARDPRLVDRACLAPVIRGGSFQDAPALCRPGFRVNFWWRGAPSIGFRVVREIRAPARPR